MPAPTGSGPRLLVRHRGGPDRPGRILGDLNPRDRQILEMRFFGGCTQAEIGAEIGVTQMQVSRLLSRLLDRLRRRLEAEPPNLTR